MEQDSCFCFFSDLCYPQKWASIKRAAGTKEGRQTLNTFRLNVIVIIITGLDLLLNIGVSYLSTKQVYFLPFVIFPFYDVKPPHAF